MRRSAAVSAMLRTMKLWRERPSDTARIDHVVEIGESLVVPLLCVRGAGDIAEIQDNSGPPLAALTQAMREVSGHQPRLCGPRSALSTIEQTKGLYHTGRYHAYQIEEGVPVNLYIKRFL